MSTTAPAAAAGVANQISQNRNALLDALRSVQRRTASAISDLEAGTMVRDASINGAILGHAAQDVEAIAVVLRALINTAGIVDMTDEVAQAALRGEFILTAK